MTTRDQPVDIEVNGQHIAGTLIAPATSIPGVLFVHGWRGHQTQYLARARQVAALGCVCLTFSLRGHGETEEQHEEVTRQDSLDDIVAAYDMLAQTNGVDKSAIGVVGTSYGGYIAALLTTLRPVKWLGLRVPALYEDHDWHLPKQQLDKAKLAAYRRGPVRPEDNAALRACREFSGDVLLVESENDDVVPHPAITSYRGAFTNTRSLTYRLIEDADHGLSKPEWQEAYTSLLVNWVTEMIIGAREEGAASPVHTQLRPSAKRGPPASA